MVLSRRMPKVSRKKNLIISVLQGVQHGHTGSQSYRNEVLPGMEGHQPIMGVGSQYYSPRVGQPNQAQTISPRAANNNTINTNRIKNSRQLPRIPTLQMQAQQRYINNQLNSPTGPIAVSHQPMNHFASPQPHGNPSTLIPTDNNRNQNAA